MWVKSFLEDKRTQNLPGACNSHTQIGMKIKQVVAPGVKSIPPWMR